MAITHFQPEVWSAQILSILGKNLVYGSAPVVNRNYEGEISAFGDTVRVTTVADPTISDYTVNTNLGTVETLTDAEILMYINQAKSFNFQVDDIDRAQSRNGGALMSEAASRAAFGLRDKADQYLAALMASSALPANTIGLIDASSTATNVYDLLIVPAGVKLDEQNVPTEGRWAVLPPAVYAKLQLDGRFIKVNEAGGSSGLRNGIVGDAGGFTIYKSNNAPGGARTGLSVTVATTAKTLTSATAGMFFQSDVGLAVSGTNITGGTTIASVDATGTVATMSAVGTSAGAITDLAVIGATHSKACIFGSPLAASYAEQISHVEAYRPELRFGDALKGLHLYGGKVFRPLGLAVGAVKTS